MALWCLGRMYAHWSGLPDCSEQLGIQAGMALVPCRWTAGRTARPKPGCITVNVGDPLQFWSDGLLKSNYHRVRMPKRASPWCAPAPLHAPVLSGWPESCSLMLAPSMTVLRPSLPLEG